MNPSIKFIPSSSTTLTAGRVEGLRAKVSIVGAGKVGSSLALKIIEESLADVLLIDVVEGLPQGLALDIGQAAVFSNSPSKIKGTNNYQDLKNSQVVVVTAGLPRKPGMSRLDLLKRNVQIVLKITQEIKKWAPQALILMVTNPLDEMAYLAHKVSGFPKNRVIGMAGTLDSARFRYFIAEKLKISFSEVEAMVLGSHGEEMVVLSRLAKVSGRPLSELLSQEEIEEIITRTKEAGSEIVSYLKEGSAFFAPSAAILEMLKSILNDEGRILPASCYLEGEYGFKGIYIGVPAKLTKNGVEEIIEFKLNSEELTLLKEAALRIQKRLKKLKVWFSKPR